MKDGCDMADAPPTTDAPLTTRACADFLGMSGEWIRQAITQGFPVDGQLVTLEAETLPTGKRRVYRIHPEAFNRFLRGIGWTRLFVVPVLAAHVG
jgi:hypothetical protein